jgi:outer membrane protein OmpA-like peptidoglycan-associated protein
LEISIMLARVLAFAAAVLISTGCPSAYDRTYDAETQRLQAEAARQRDEAHKYVAIVLFAVGSDVIDEAGAREIEWFLEQIASYPLVHIDVKGFTDSTGSEAQNAPLSNERAWAVQDNLVSRGIAPDRVSASGYSADQPARTNTTSPGRKQNRRAEIRAR